MMLCYFIMLYTSCRRSVYNATLHTIAVTNLFLSSRSNLLFSRMLFVTTVFFFMASLLLMSSSHYPSLMITLPDRPTETVLIVQLPVHKCTSSTVGPFPLYEVCTLAWSFYIYFTFTFTFIPLPVMTLLVLSINSGVLLFTIATTAS